MIQILILILIIIGGIAGYLQHSLSRNGAIAAVLVGIAVYFGFGVKGLILLGLFFVTSSSWSKFKSTAKIEMEEKLAK